MEPIFKVGDLVKIRHREGKQSEYKFLFTDAMVEMEGFICEITYVEKDYVNTEFPYKDDNAKYKLKLVDKNGNSSTNNPLGFTWSSAHLEKYVKSETKESNMYKVGDLVRIIPRTGDKDDYKFSYSDGMTDLEGVVCRIVGISKSDYKDCKIPDDGNEYELEFAYESDKYEYEDEPDGYNWASSMFEKYEEDESEITTEHEIGKYKEGDLVKIKHREGDSIDYRFLFSDDMLPLEGAICRITHVWKNPHMHSKRFKDDAMEYHLEFANKEDEERYPKKPETFCWASSMFERYEGIVYTRKEKYRLNFKI